MLILRPYQEQIKADVYAAWNAGHRNVLMVLPTGLGKTKTFSSIAIDKAVLPLIGKMPTAILVHRKELVQQISLTLAEEEIEHNIIAPRSTILGIVAAQRQLLKKQFYNYSANVTVISVDTLNARIAKHEKWAKSIRLWITDEAAHVLRDNKWGKAVSYFTDAVGLGVTATPQRLDKRGLGSHVDGVFDIMVEGPNSRWGIKNGFLCDYKVAVPQSDYQNYLKKASEGSDYTREAMAKASAQSHIVGDAVVNYKKFANGKQSIVFASDIAAGERMEYAFKEAGITAKLLTGETPDKERLAALIAFREKKTRVLINIDLFDEGLDVPGIECVQMCRPTMSLSKYLQMCGRGLRPAPDKPFLIIIDQVGNVARHGLPCQPRRWTLDRIVRRRDRTNLIRICSNFECNSPFDRILTSCPYCGTDIPKPVAGEGGARPGPEQVDGDLFLLDPITLRELEAQAVLEDPGLVAQRVSRAAGAAAGIRAAKNQKARIETQKELVDEIALWAGAERMAGLSDRSIHKKFYLLYDMTITEALGQERALMLEMLEQLRGGKDETRKNAQAPSGGSNVVRSEDEAGRNSSDPDSEPG